MTVIDELLALVDRLTGHNQQADTPGIRPTPTEQAEAWRRGHCDEEPEDE